MRKRIVFGLSLLLIVGLGIGCSESDSDAGVGKQGEGGGFLWKPQSESDGRLVVLLPSQYRGNVQSVHIANPEGDVIELGRFAGDTHNGNRPHYRFTQSGAAYGTDIYVVADLSEGETVHWPIPNGASRQEY